MYNINVSFTDQVVFFSVEGFAQRMEITFRELRSSAKTCTALYDDGSGVSHYTLNKAQANQLFTMVNRAA